VDSVRVEELVNASRPAAFLDDASEAIRALDEAIADSTSPGHIGHLLLARGIAQQGASDIRPAANDCRASINYLLEAGDHSAAAFAMASSAGMVQRTGDMAAALDLAVDAMVLIPEQDLHDEYQVRAANSMALLFAQFSAFDLAISSSRRAFRGAMELPDRSSRSITGYTLGFCAVEAIYSGHVEPSRRREFELDLDDAIQWLVSPGAGAMERAVLGSGMRSERILLESLGPDDTSAAADPSDLPGALIHWRSRSPAEQSSNWRDPSFAAAPRTSPSKHPKTPSPGLPLAVGSNSNWTR